MTKALWADSRVLFLTLGICTVAAVVGLVLLQNHSATSYHKSIQANEMAAIASTMTMDSWAMNVAVALLNDQTPPNPNVTYAPDLQTSLNSIEAKLQRYRQDSSVGGPKAVTNLIDPIIAELEKAVHLQEQGNALDALPVLEGATYRLSVALPEITAIAERFEAEARDTRRLTTFSSIGIFALALGAMGFVLHLYRHARHNIEASEAEQEILRRSEARFRPLVQNMADIIVVLDGEFAIQYLSPSSERILGYRLDEVLQKRASDVVHPDDLPQLNAFYAELSARPNYTGTINVRVCDSQGRDLYLEVVGTNLLRDPDVNGIVLNCRNVTDRHAMEEQLRHQAFHDSLTQLANRLRFTERLEYALLRGRQDHRAGAFSVLYMDLDRFKNVNDELGHTVGDALLQQVARRLLGCVRPADTAARLGGDEFAILLESAHDADAARQVADRILDAMSQPFEIGGNHIRLTASIGIVVADPQTTTCEEVIRNADVAMYDAKQNGRGCAHLYEADMHLKLIERLRLASDLQAAVESNEFLVYYQPVVDLRSERIMGFEALARWEHPSRGILLPSEFIALAEEVGVIQPLGEKVLLEACRKATRWSEECRNVGSLTISVNVSPRQIEKAGFPQLVQRVIDETGIDPALLILEITETMLASSPAEIAVTLTELKALGVRIALDDFGTGFSSLNSLKHFPIDILKIDRSFTEELDLTDKGRLLVQTVIELGTTLNMEIVAEGIERTDQLTRLNVLHCDAGQGYLFAEPLDEDHADDLVTRYVAQSLVAVHQPPAQESSAA